MECANGIKYPILHQVPTGSCMFHFIGGCNVSEELSASAREHLTVWCGLQSSLCKLCVSMDTKWLESAHGVLHVPELQNFL